MHAYQSYIWNRSVTQRFKRFGKKILIGDLAIRKEKAFLVDNELVEDDAAAVEEEEKDENANLHPAES